MEFIDKQFEKISFGQPVSHIKLIYMAFLAYPLAFIMKKLKKTQSRHLFSIIPGFIIMYILFNEKALHLIGCATLVYIILRLNLPHKIITVWVTTFAWLSLLHLQVESDKGTGYKCDVTGSFMILTLKLISLASNLVDGKKDPEKLRGQMKLHRVTEMPTIIEYVSYLFYYGSINVGPLFDFVPFKNFITRKMFLNDKNDKKQIEKEKGILRRANWAGLKILSFSIITMIMYLALGMKFDYEDVTSPKIQNSNFIVRHLNFYFLGLYLRTRYYLAFFNTEGANIIAGFGYNGTDENGNEKWDQVTNVKLKPTEFPKHSRDYLNNWNYQVCVWMRNYVYFRINSKPTPLRKNIGQIATFVLSSFWHGFRYCYYIIFPLCLPFDYADRMLMKAIAPYLKGKDGKPNKTRVLIYETINRIFVTLYWSGSITVFFISYSFEQTKILIKMTYIPLIIIPWAIIIIITLKNMFFRKKRTRSDKSEKEKKNQNESKKKN
ncbi:oysgedart [Anaeramoeba flamelloides]|uniref:Oysgedart n=1 Tax=Anaeramoeba flamelloides TaxID=1746091 RepID=A0ABQ8XMC2_9EUKA|nr:oysgedart [Anaeramoeba flamelloides]